MYPEDLIEPMRKELTNAGFQEIRESGPREKAIAHGKGTTLVVINSVCGCAAAAARPGVLLAIDKSQDKPDHLVTAFAGNDKASVDKARDLMLPFPPSSPCMALFKDGELVHMLERHHIEGRPAEMISENLITAFAEHC
jgi:putative YphP/YqiW family bacilliredoxin